MNLWIRSQNGQAIKKANYEIYYNERNGHNYIVVDGDALGSYKTKERALEVLDEIQDMITLNEHISGDYQTSDLLIKSKYLEHQVKIFVMPKE